MRTFLPGALGPERLDLISSTPQKGFSGNREQRIRPGPKMDNNPRSPTLSCAFDPEAAAIPVKPHVNQSPPSWHSLF